MALCLMYRTVIFHAGMLETTNRDTHETKNHRDARKNTQRHAQKNKQRHARNSNPIDTRNKKAPTCKKQEKTTDMHKTTYYRHEVKKKHAQNKTRNSHGT